MHSKCHTFFNYQRVSPPTLADNTWFFTCDSAVVVLKSQADLVRRLWDGFRCNLVRNRHVGFIWKWPILYIYNIKIIYIYTLKSCTFNGENHKQPEISGSYPILRQTHWPWQCSAFVARLRWQNLPKTSICRRRQHFRNANCEQFQESTWVN